MGSFMGSNYIILTYGMEVIYNIIGEVVVNVDYVHDSWVIRFRIPLVISFDSIKDIISVLESVIRMVHF